MWGVSGGLLAWGALPGPPAPNAGGGSPPSLKSSQLCLKARPTRAPPLPYLVL